MSSESVERWVESKFGEEFYKSPDKASELVSRKGDIRLQHWFEGNTKNTTYHKGSKDSHGDKDATAVWGGFKRVDRFENKVEQAQEKYKNKVMEDIRASQAFTPEQRIPELEKTRSSLDNEYQRKTLIDLNTLLAQEIDKTEGLDIGLKYDRVATQINNSKDKVELDAIINRFEGLPGREQRDLMRLWRDKNKEFAQKAQAEEQVRQEAERARQAEARKAARKNRRSKV
jgi:hypothetical protein